MRDLYLLWKQPAGTTVCMETYITSGRGRISGMYNIYQHVMGYNMFFSGIHLDAVTVLSPEEWNESHKISKP